MKNKIDLSRGKPHAIEASYGCYLHFPLDHLDIDWNEVKNIWVKWGIAYIEMNDGETHKIEGHETETDYKWAIETRMFNEEYDEIWEEIE